jgi:prepilin-type N-terminal cleavage/methylation domain-containing protein
MSPRPRSQEHGFTLIELMLVMTLFVVLLGATLEASALFTRNNALAERRNDQAEQARSALDRQARQLRNLAQRIDVRPVINRALKYDLIFQTRDPTRTWVRYCLDNAAAPATLARGRMWFMTSDTPAAPTSTACQKGTWETATVVSDSVANRAGNADRPVFSYSCLSGQNPCPPADFTRVTGVGSTLYVDDDVTRVPSELRVSTSVYLRNQNEPPVAKIGVPGYPRTRTVFLNGSESYDAEGRTLRYFWFPSATAPTFRCDTGPSATTIFFRGITLTYTFPTSIPTTTSPTHPFTLVVCDPGNLQGVSAPVLVRVPA